MSDGEIAVTIGIAAIGALVAATVMILGTLGVRWVIDRIDERDRK